MTKGNVCEVLIDEALELLEAEEPQKALKIGKKIEAEWFEKGLEIQAIAFDAMDKREKAIDILEKGTSSSPETWFLWQLLGNYYSEDGKFEKSIAAFENGLKASDADFVSLNYNYAIALSLNEDWGKSNKKILEIFSSKAFPDDVENSLYFAILGLYCFHLNLMKQYEDAIYFFEGEQLNISKRETENSIELSDILAEIGYSYLMLNQAGRAHDYLKKAIKESKDSPKAQWLYREINKDKDFSKAKQFSVMVEGVWHEPPEEGTRFFTSYLINADDADEALEIIKYFEPSELHASLKIEEIEIELETPNQPKGVYETNPYVFFEDDDE